MHLRVDPVALHGLADGVRRAAAATEGLALPGVPPCEDVAASDAVAALLAVCGEQRDALAAALRDAAVLVETARHDYARVETAAAGPRR